MAKTLGEVCLRSRLCTALRRTWIHRGKIATIYNQEKLVLLLGWVALVVLCLLIVLAELSEKSLISPLHEP